jgi:hypothetical protein
MVFRIGTLMEKGKFNWKGLNKILHDHEKRIDDLESSGGSGYDDTEVKADITALETAIGDESTEGSILARIKALEDAP